MKRSNYLKACSASFSQSVEYLILDLHPELLSGLLKVSTCSGHDIISVDVDGKCQSSVGKAPFCSQTWPRFWGGHFMTILSHGAENVHSQVWQRFCRPASQCAVTGLGHKTVAKILWTTCLSSLLVQENISSCCFFSYLELHCHHHRSHREIYIILSEASVTHLAL